MKKKRFKPKQISLDIKGIKWTFKYVSTDTYKRKFGRNSDAITIVNDREVYFFPDGLSTETVKHELFHCLVDSSETFSMDMSLDNFEELCAVLASKYNLQLEMWANEIIDHFLKS